MLRLTLIFILTLFAADAAVAQLSDAERRIAAHVDATNDEAFELLGRAVDINSGTMNFDGVQEVGRVFGEAFADVGFETNWVDGEAWGRAGHLIAEHPGEGLRVVLVGHLDTVFEPDSPFQSYEPLGGNKARGPGAVDMKGGVVVILQAMRALREVGALDDLHVTVVLHGDEEKSGRPLEKARQHLVEAAKGADVAIGFEPGDGNPATAVISRRGWTGWMLEVTGKPAHSSQVFQPRVGAGAAYEMSRILYQFYEELSDEDFLTFNPGAVLAGTDVAFDPSEDRGSAFGKSNVIAERAVVSGDLRTLDAEQRERAKERMRAIVSENLPHTSAEITFEDTYPPMAPTDGNRRLLEMYSRVSEDLGTGPVAAVNPQHAGAADISFAAAHAEMAIDGLGLMGEGSHTVNEAAHLQTLSSQAKRAAILLYRLANR